MRSKLILSFAALLVLVAGSQLAHAQTASPSPSESPSASASPTTPGAPNTGAGGSAATNVLVLGISALVAAGGVTYLSRRTAAL